MRSRRGAPFLSLPHLEHVEPGMCGGGGGPNPDDWEIQLVGLAANAAPPLYQLLAG